MPKRLNGSANTGKKIMHNLDTFSYSYIGPDNSTSTTNYRYECTFGSQSGTAVISLTKDNHIGQSSTLNCDQNRYDFLRPLGAYNDPTLYDVFAMMLDNAVRYRAQIIS